MTWRTALARRMPGTRRARVATAVAAVLAMVALTAVVFASGDGSASPVRTSDQRVEVAAAPGAAGRIPLDTTVFWPDTDRPAPAVLLGHGFGGSKATVRSEAAALARRGFVVMTWSARGFGTSGGLIALDQPDYEVADARSLVDWLAARPEVRLDGPGDPRVGAAGVSYGGALALLLAAYDARVDAVASQWTWHDLADALLPNATGAGPEAGVFKKMWAGVFFSAGASSITSPAPGAQGDTASVCGRFDPAVCSVYEEVARTGRATPQAVELLRRASPGTVADRIRVPTLLVQGQNDSLFPLSEADRTARAVSGNGFPVEMVWTSGGHDGGARQTALVGERTAAWFDRWLASDAGARDTAQRRAGGSPGPVPAGPFAVTRLGGVDTSTREQVVRVATGPSYPGADGSVRRDVALAGLEQTVVNPPGGSPPSMSTLPGLGLLGTLGQLGDAGAASGGFSLDMPGQSAFFTSEPLDRPLRVTGGSTVRVKVSGADDIVLFAKLYDVDPSGGAVLPYQLAAPIRVVGARDGRDVEIRLPVIDREIDTRHRLRLVLTTTDLGYATPVEPAAYRVAVTGPLVVPSVSGLKPPPPGYPWWTWGLPAGAAVAAAVIVLTGRRRRAARAPVAGLAEVPLLITGLTKRYKGGKLAVDDVSFEVARGQVLGLLGPNGAGKTTTLRMLMGLIHPDGGEIRIFGHIVTPGAPVLSRLGSFVEGPGFLPHLSGRDNLGLYWQATGRPPEDAHFDEALEIAGLGEALDRKVRTYSQGMRQRLAIAQAMLGLPDLLVLDEPTNGLDPPQIRAMRDVLIRYASGESGKPGDAVAGDGSGGPEEHGDHGDTGERDGFGEPGKAAVSGEPGEPAEPVEVGRPDESTEAGVPGKADEPTEAGVFREAGVSGEASLSTEMAGVSTDAGESGKARETGAAAGGRTVVVSSHLLAEVEQTCTHVVVMRRGRLVAAGPVGDITGDGHTLAIGTPVPARAVAALAGMPGIASAEPEGDGIVVHLAGAEASAVVAELVGAGVAVDRVTAKRRLEDAFLTLIGDQH